MSNTERQRQFRRKHPGYYQRLHARRRAGQKARLDALAAARAEAAACAVAVAAPVPAIPSILDIIRAQPLMLPAPVEELVFAIPERELVMIRPI